ncbi:hypothetical protein GWK36_08795 [Caldichromatium japonicum]|uniref:DUF7931 domain-containing protein n=1 Tax=Caldichromatium japonicum TaxID=2699430 RepID=A0A6G7VDL9_9GAMM|nr:hypothetical protein [Caldichromatium japonicum]QIK38064.1 hypothetical protein GWK36_08795 [Caldichromatium japonicum]
MPQFSQRLGLDYEALRLSGAQEIAAVCAQMGAQARLELLLCDPLLEPALYDQVPFLQAVRQLALNRPTLCVLVLVFDPKTITQRGHRLVDLAQHLSSRIAIQRVADEDQERPDAFLVVDGLGYVRRQQAERMLAVADYGDRLMARRLIAEFTQLWERSTPDAELRRLFI